MVEVDPVPKAMHHGEEETGQSNDLVEREVGIKWNIVVEGGFPEECDEVPSHCEQQHGVSEHHAGSSTSGDGHTIASDAAQTNMLSLHGIVYSG